MQKLLKFAILPIFLFAIVFLVSFSSAAFVDSGGLQQNVSDCGTLSTAGAVYDLNTSIQCAGTAITISANNITFDGHGYIINYSTSGNASDAGIKVNSNNVSILNQIVLDSNLTTANTSRHAIFINGGNYSYVFNNSAYAKTNNSIGIVLFRSYNSIVKNSFASSSGTSTNSFAIEFSSGSNNTLLYSVGISNSSYGIYLLTSSNNTLIGNNGTATANGQGIRLENSANYNNLTNNYGTSAQSNGITVTASSAYNWLYGNVGTSLAGQSGIQLFSIAQNNTLINNNGTSISGVGIYLQTNANGNVLTGNRGVSGSSNGIKVETSINNSLSNNNGIGGTAGIYLLNSNTTILNLNNGTSVNNAGIRLDTSQYNTLTNNWGYSTCAFSTCRGLYLLTASNNIINSNTAISGQGSGFEIITQSNNNSFSNNMPITLTTSYAMFLKQVTQNIFSNNSYTSGTGFASVGIENSSGNSWTNIRAGFSVKGLVNATQNNFSITQGLIWNSTSIKDGLTGDIASNTGTYTIPIAINSVVYVANYLNITEGVSVVNSPFSLTVVDMSHRTMSNSLRDAVNITAIFSVADCDSLGNIDYVTSGFSKLYKSGSYSCSSNSLNMVVQNLQSSGQFSLSFACNQYVKIGDSLILLFAAFGILFTVLALMWKNGIFAKMELKHFVIMFIAIAIGITMIIGAADSIAVSCAP